MQLGSSGIDRGYGGEKLARYSDDLQSVMMMDDQMMECHAQEKQNKYTVTISFVTNAIKFSIDAWRC